MTYQKLSDKVYEYILAQVMVGAFAVQTRLPSEMRLAELLHVSRPVVREALQRLREDGLIASRRGSGSLVIRRPNQAISGFAPISTIADIQRCFIFREAIEGEAAALAARYYNGPALKKIRIFLETLNELLTQNKPGADEDFEFHLAIAEATGNQFFSATLMAIREQITTGLTLNHKLSLSQSAKDMILIRNEHEAIYAAIAARDEEAARHAMRAHINQARKRIFDGTVVDDVPR